MSADVCSVLSINDPISTLCRNVHASSLFPLHQNHFFFLPSNFRLRQVKYVLLRLSSLSFDPSKGRRRKEVFQMIHAK